MKFTISKSSPQSFKADIIAIGCYERQREEGDIKRRPALIKHADGGIVLDKALGGSLSKQMAIEGFTGERGKSRLFFTAGKIPARFILVIGLGPREKFDLEILREAGAEMARMSKSVSASSIALVLERGPVGEDTAPARARAIAEGVILGGYKFDRYKTGAKDDIRDHSTTAFLYQGEAKAVRDAIEAGKIVADATLICRDLVNTPASDATPSILAKRANELSDDAGLSCTVWGSDLIKKNRMNGLLAVAKGSADPAFIIMNYKPKEKPKAHIILVGKGITFDAGGISLKPPKSMEGMKMDMAGGGVVMAAMWAIGKIRPNVEVSGYIPAAENLPDGLASKPGDIVTMRNGKTVEIVSADCEGRMVVADALSYASDQRPDVLVDLATLTGGAVYCCGELYTLVLGNDQRAIDRICRAADCVGELVWQLPIVESYMKGYTSGIADLNNTGKSRAQTINGALFLREFIDRTSWVHLDIAASSSTDEDVPLSPKGATGAMVRTIIGFIMGYKRGAISDDVNCV